MPKYYSISFWKRDDSGGRVEDKKLRTWEEIMEVLRSMYIDCDELTIRYVGVR